MPKPICSPLGRSVELRANYAPLDVRLDVILDPQPLEEVEDDHFISLTGYNDSLCPEIRQVYEGIAEELPLLAPDIAQAGSNIECAVLRVIFLWAALGEINLYVGGKRSRVFRIRTTVWTTNRIGFLPLETVATGLFVIARSLCPSRTDRANEGGPALIRPGEVEHALTPQDASEAELKRAVDAVIAQGLRQKKPPTRTEQKKEVVRRLMLIRRKAAKKEAIPALLRERSPEEWAKAGRRAE